MTRDLITTRINKFKRTLSLKMFNLIFEMHQLVHFNPTIAGLMLSVDYLMNIVLIVYLRIVQIYDNSDQLLLTHLNVVYFVNEVLFNKVVDIIINVFMLLSFFFFVIMFAKTNPKKHRRKSSAWKLNLLLMIQYFIHTTFSIITITNQVCNIISPAQEENFISIKGSNMYRGFLSCFSFLIYFANTYFVDSIYNFQFIGINGETGILSNTKKFTLLLPLFKYLAIIAYFSDLQVEVHSIIFIVISLAYLIQLYLRFTQSYNFSKFLSEIEVTCLAICCYNYIFCVLITLLNFQIQTGDILLCILFNPVLALFVYLMKRKSWDTKLYSKFLNIKNIPEKEIYAYRMIECILKFELEDQLLLSGVIKAHKQQCTSAQCPCTMAKMMEQINDLQHLELIIDFKFNKVSPNFQSKKYQETKSEDEIQFQGSLKSLKSPQQLIYIHILLKWLQISYEEMNQHRMRMIQAFIQTDILQKDLSALFLISSLKHVKLTNQEKVAIFCYQKIIFEKVNSRMKNLNQFSLEIGQIQKTVSTQRKIKKLYHYIENTVSLCQDFWKEIVTSDKQTNVFKLHKQSEEIAKHQNQADKQFRSIKKIQPDFVMIIVFYEKFLRDIMHYDNEALREQNEINIIIQRKRIQNLRVQGFRQEILDINKNVAIVVVKSSFSKIGQISQVNEELKKLTGLDDSRFKNSNISILLPNIIKETEHNQLIERFFTQKTSTKFINTLQTTMIKDFKGYLHLVEMLIQPFYDQIEGLQFIGFFKKPQEIYIKDQVIKYKDVMGVIVDQNGLIHQTTKNFVKLLKFSNLQDLKFSDLSIGQVCPQIDFNKQDFTDLKEGSEVDLLVNEQLKSPSFSQSDDEQKIMSKEQRKFESSWFKSNVNSIQSVSESYQQHQKEVSSYFKSKITIEESKDDSYQRPLEFERQRTHKALVKADLTFWIDHKYFNFGVFFFALQKTQNASGNIKIKLDKEMSNNIEIESYSQPEASQSSTNSASQSSGSKQFSQLLNLKSGFDIKKKPQIIGHLQKIFITYFLIIVALSSTIMSVSIENTQNFIKQLEIYYNSRSMMFRLAELRKNVQEYTYFINGNTAMTSLVMEDRLSFLSYNVFSQIEDLKSITNKINNYLLTHKDSSDGFVSYLSEDLVEMRNLLPNGTFETTQQTLAPSMERFITSIQNVMEYDPRTFKCNCFFRPEELDQMYIYSIQERTAYFIDYNSITSLGTKIWKAADIFQTLFHIYYTLSFYQVIIDKSTELLSLILYFSIPGMIISIICSFAFIPVIKKNLRNKKNVISLVSQMGVDTANEELKKINKFQKYLQKTKLDANFELKKEKKEKLFISKQSYSIDQNNTSLVDQTIGNLIPDEINYRKSIKQKSQKEAFGDNKQKEQLEVQNDDQLQNDQDAALIMTSIEKQFKRKGLVQGAYVLLGSMVFCIFFVVMYFLNAEALIGTEQSLDSFSSIIKRAICMSTIPLYTKQIILQNRTVSIPFLDESSQDHLFDYCMLNNFAVQELRKAPTPSMQGALRLIEQAESGDLCQLIDALISENPEIMKNKPLACNKVLNGMIIV